MGLSWTIKQKALILVLFSSFATLEHISVPTSAVAQTFAPEPMRLAVRVARTPVTVGMKGQLMVTFLDRKYQATTNDAKRIVELEAKPPGMVEIPQSVEALPGQGEVPVAFTARKPGV